MALDRFRENETEHNRVRKLNALIDALGLAEGATLDPAVLPAATASTLGVVKEGTGVTVAADGTLSAVLPIATASTLGVVKAGTGVTVAADGTLSAP